MAELPEDLKLQFASQSSFYWKSPYTHLPISDPSHPSFQISAPTPGFRHVRPPPELIYWYLPLHFPYSSSEVRNRSRFFRCSISPIRSLLSLPARDLVVGVAAAGVLRRCARLAWRPPAGRCRDRWDRSWCRRLGVLGRFRNRWCKVRRRCPNFRIWEREMTSLPPTIWIKKISF